MEELAGRIVVFGHDRHYPDPICLKKGEEFTLSGRSVAWEGNEEHLWLWAIANDGREGWVAKDFPQHRDGKIFAPFDYNSIELSVVPGDELQVLEEVLGWAHCKTLKGELGWVPVRVFG
ncbi:MAG: hypothetical protein L3J21_06370 [Devosiaceae bacterium]|nr:hypothetical protein [Devosiaceae bacterium]